MATNSAEATWVDLSKLGLFMGWHKDPHDPSKSLPLAMVDVHNAHDKALRTLGFKPMEGARTAGIYVRDNASLTAPMLREAFGSEHVKFVKGARDGFLKTFQTKFREKTNVNAKVAFAQRRMLGINHLGESVFESSLGREIVRTAAGLPRRVVEEADSGAEFLRARDKSDLAKVVAGFLQRITRRGETLRRADLKELIVLSNDGDFSPRDYQEAVEAEANALFSIEIQKAGAAEAANSLAAYDVAERIYHGLPELRERTANSIVNQQYSTPLPMAVLAQALLMAGAARHGATVLDPTIGNANLVSLLAAQRDNGAGFEIYGAEIDPARVEAAQRVANAVVLGDATQINFRREFCQPDGFDLVIANPPFGSMDSREAVQLPPGSAVPTMDIRRLDQFLMLNALHARKDSGRAVFITGADNVIRAGEVLGTSKHLLAYLYDHYDIESVVDVSGELYKKQGAGYPLRLYVVGARRASPVETSVPEVLPVIRSYEGLRAWGGDLLKRHEVTAELERNTVVSREGAATSPDLRTQGEAVRRVVTPPRPKQQDEHGDEVAPVPLDSGVEPALPVADVVESVTAQVDSVEELFTQHQKTLVEEPAADGREESEFQHRYVAFSNVSEPTTMIPANLSGPVYEALTQIRVDHGDIDEYVAGQMEYPVDDLGRYFSAEQIDALAMIFAATEKKLGFLLADQMGVGKGRVLAGFARRERLQGRIPMFITVTDNLFSDFLERDISAIDSRHLFQNPLIVNDESKTVDAEGKVIVRALKRPEYRRHAELGELPEGTDIILLTYSQLARRHETHLTSRYMRTLCANYPISLMLDESHKGAGASHTSENLAAMINGLDHTGGSTVYSSGTPIKGAKNLSLYRKILPQGVNPDELLDAVMSDPISLQEALNYEIAAQGCLISRELDNTGIEKEFIVSRYLERNEVIADQLSDILSAMNFMSGDVKKIVKKLNKNFEKELTSIPAGERAGARMGATSMNFGSRMHALVNQMLLALKSQEVVDLAIEALEAGKKPIIALMRTGESMLSDYVSEANAAYNESPDRVSKTVGEVILDKPISFKDYLYKTLEKIMWVTKVSRYGDVTRDRVNSKEMLESAASIKDLVEKLPDDLPLAPLDFFREKLAERGYTMGEISGRKLRSRALENGGVTIEAIPGASDKTRKNTVVREFNNGDIDVIVLTGAGSTGLSVQASPFVGRDVRTRVMIKAEMQPDIAAERQMDGRHNRTGQIVKPEYKIPTTGLPADDRQAMMFNTKNRSLTASTVSNRDSKEIIREVPDLLNVVGDWVAEELLSESPDLAKHLDIEMSEDGDSYMKAPLHYIKVLTGRICLLRVVEQRALYADLQARFLEKVDKLKAEGRNPLEVECHDWRAKVVDRRVFMGAVNKKADSRSQFNAPVFLTQVEYQEEVKAFTALEVDAKIAAALVDGVPNSAVILSYLQEHRDDILRRYAPKRFETVQEALDHKDPNEAKNALAKLQWLDHNLPYLKPGAIYMHEDLEGVEIPTVITRVAMPGTLEGYMRLADYTFYAMRPGSDLVRLVTASSLFAQHVDIDPNAFLEHDEVRDAFNAADNGMVTRRARVLDGNLFDATSLNLRENLGRKIVYTDESGARQHGILVRADMTDKKLASIPERVRGAELIAKFAEFRPVTTHSTGDWREPLGTQLRKGSAGRLELAVPGTKKAGGHVFGDEVLTKIAGKEPACEFHLDFRSVGGRMVATVPESRAVEIVQYLLDRHGAAFFTLERDELDRVRDILHRESAAMDLQVA
jgi:hypothetical protein